MLLPAGEIRIVSNGAGNVHVEAPLDNKELCMLMISYALKAIAEAAAPLIVPATNGSPVKLHNKRS